MDHIATAAIEQLEPRRLWTAVLFANKIAFPSGGIEPGDTAIADVNNDHRPDIVFGNSQSLALGVLINKGNNNFSGPKITGGFDVSHVATADFDGDGTIDVVAAAETAYLVILKGRGDGHFDYVKKIFASNVSKIVTADFNGDGKPDIAATETDREDILLMFNRGGDSFSAVKRINTSTFPEGLVATDLNGDGKLDLVESALGQGADPTDLSCGIDYFLGNGAGAFSARTHYHFVGAAYDLAVADLNRDKVPDILLPNSGTASSAGIADSMTVLLGKKSGGFKLFHSNASLGDPRGITTADFNGDGFIDAAVACQNSSKTSIFLGKGDGTFQSSRGILAAPGATSVSVADLNKDGRADLVFNGTGDNTIDVLFQI